MSCRGCRELVTSCATQDRGIGGKTGRSGHRTQCTEASLGSSAIKVPKTIGGRSRQMRISMLQENGHDSTVTISTFCAGTDIPAGAWRPADIITFSPMYFGPFEDFGFCFDAGKNHDARPERYWSSKNTIWGAVLDVISSTRLLPWRSRTYSFRSSRSIADTLVAAQVLNVEFSGAYAGNIRCVYGAGLEGAIGGPGGWRRSGTALRARKRFGVGLLRWPKGSRSGKQQRLR